METCTGAWLIYNIQSHEQTSKEYIVIFNTSDFINNSVTSAMNVFGTNHVLESVVFTDWQGRRNRSFCKGKQF